MSSALAGLATLLFAEAAVLMIAVAWLLLELVTTTPASFATAIAFVVLAAIAAAWVLATAINTLRTRPWIRASTITWQIVQGAIALSALQGAGASPLVGWLLIAASIAGIVLVLTPGVVRATARGGTEDKAG